MPDVFGGASTTVTLDVALAPMAAGPNVLLVATSGQTIRLHRGHLYFGGACRITIRSGSATGKILRRLIRTRAGNAVFDFSGLPWCETKPSEDLVLVTDNAVECSGSLDITVQ